MKTSFMKNYVSIPVLFFLLLLGASSCSVSVSGPKKISGSKNVISEVRESYYFNAVEVSNAMNLFINIGEDFHIEVKADDNVVPLILTEVEDDILKVRLTPGYSFRNVKSKEVHVTMPMLTSIRAGGASNVLVKNTVVGNALNIHASGASDVKLSVDLAYLEVRLSGASDMNISGFSEFTKARLSGASDIKSYSFSCDLLDAVLSGASEAKITVNKKVTGNLSGASDIKIKGDPLIDVKTSGASSIVITAK